MKLRHLASLLSLALVAAPLVRAQDSAPAAPAAPAAAPSGEKHTELEKQMGGVAKAMRTLRKQITDATKNDSSIDLVQKMIDGLKGGLDMTPAKAADVPADQKADFIAKYKKGIQDMIDKLTALQADLKAGKNDAAANDLKDIQATEKQDHKEFQKEKPQA